MLLLDRVRGCLFALIVISAVSSFQSFSQEHRAELAGQSVLWTDPGDVASLDFKYGIGGSERQPEPPFQFVNEDTSGTNPKINVTDNRGSVWNVKWGEEASPATFCSRILWACGYFTVPEYFLAEGRIDGVRNLRRARPWVSRDGSFVNARFQLRSESPRYLSDRHWTWKDNPFLATEQLQGLKILVLLVSNWDPKESNLRIFEDDSSAGLRYLYADVDWGASLGQWGGRMSRTKWNCNGFEKETSDFVTLADDGSLQWGFRGKNQKDVTSGITIAQLRWLLKYLGQITDDQIVEGLTASGANPADVDCFARSLRMRIQQLQRIAS